jgi:hypothetical protein
MDRDRQENLDIYHSHGRGPRFDTAIAHQEIPRVYEIDRKPFLFPCPPYVLQTPSRPLDSHLSSFL